MIIPFTVVTLTTSASIFYPDRTSSRHRWLWISLFKQDPQGGLFQIGQWLEQHPLAPDGIIQISIDKDAANFVFPWSILYDRELPSQNYVLPDLQGFWGLRYCIEQRLPARMYTDTSIDRTKPVKLGFMLWKQFRNSVQEQDFFKKLKEISLGKLEVSLPPIVNADDCIRLLQDSDAQILYFYTHGYTRHRLEDIGVGQDLSLFLRRFEALEPDSPVRQIWQFLYDSIKKKEFEPDRSWIELSYGRLFLDDLYGGIQNLPSRPFVFLNMCESAQITPSLSDSFIHFFLTRGARSVLGTECPMTVEFAQPFAHAFLNRFLSGEMAGKALLQARRLFIEQQNPLGLAYTLFGQATLRLAPPIIAMDVPGNI